LVGVVAQFKLNESEGANRRYAAIENSKFHTTGIAKSLGTQTESQVGEFGINLDNAIKAHADWRSKLRQAAQRSEQLDAATIGRDDCCELGKWLHGLGQSQCGSKPSFTGLISAHKDFHKEAGKVAQTVNQGDGDGAEKMLGSDTGFSKASSNVTRLIVQLRSECTDKSTAASVRFVAKLNDFSNTPKASTRSVLARVDEDWETF
jgi:hypothetical protein